MRAFLLLMLFSILLVTPAPGQDWNIQLVDDSGDVGYHSEIVVLSDGMPCIAYYAGGYMRLAWWVEEGDDSGWNYTVLEQMGNYPFEMLVDSEDLLHLVWSRSYYGVYYGIYDLETETWALDSEAIPGSPTYAAAGMTLVEDGLDKIPYVVLNASNDKVWAGRRDPGTGIWSVEQVSAIFNCFGVASIGVDSLDGQHISFYEPVGDNLMYAVKTGGGTEWMLQTIDIEDNTGEFSSIIVDDSDVIHIAYYDRTNGDLKFATSTP